MKILVTGGTGFLGRHIVWRLAAEGVNVVFTGRSRRAAEIVSSQAAIPVQWHSLNHGSAKAAEQLSMLAMGADAVVHCAALSAPWGSKADFHSANIDSTAEVLAACHIANVPRLVHISTPSLYFDYKDRIGIREDCALPSPVNEYARTKLEAEKMVRASSSRIPAVVILRPRAIYGPWDETLLPRLMRVMASGPVPLLRGGNAMMDISYVGNVVDAVWLSLTSRLPSKLVCYNVSNGEPVQFSDLLQRISTEFNIPLKTRAVSWPLIYGVASMLEAAGKLDGREPMITRYGAGALAFSQTLDITAITRDLGYLPRVSVDEGIRMHAQWWKDRQAWV